MRIVNVKTLSVQKFFAFLLYYFLKYTRIWLIVSAFNNEYLVIQYQKVMFDMGMCFGIEINVSYADCFGKTYHRVANSCGKHAGVFGWFNQSIVITIVHFDWLIKNIENV